MNKDYFILEDLMTPEKLKYFTKLFYNDSQKEVKEENSSIFKWINYGGENLKKTILPQNESQWDKENDLIKIVNFARDFIIKNYKIQDKNLKLKKYFIHIMLEEREIATHVDDRNPNDEHYSAIFIINNNYEGGEFFFSKLNKEIKLKAGSLLVFKGDAKREHKVKKIKKGYRVSIPIFFKNGVE